MIARRIVPAAAIACVAAPASAQDYTYTPKESDRSLAEYSECVIGSRQGQERAIAFLRHVPNTPEWLAAGNRLVYPDCLRSPFGQARMRVSPLTLRPAMFAALYRRRFGKTVPASLAGEPPLTLSRLFDGPPDAVPKQNIAQLAFGSCVARADTAAAHRLLVARPWTSAEDAALPAVTEAMRGCLTDSQTLRLNRSTARGVIAEALYDLSSARAAGAATADPAPADQR